MSQKICEERKSLQPYLNKRIEISGLYSKSDWFTDHHARREYRTACISKVEDSQGNMLSDHVWIHRANRLMEQQPKYGERINLTALVIQYKDKEGVVKYHLDSPEDIDFPDRNGVALRIPEPRPESPNVETPKPVKVEAQGGDPCAVLFKVLALADEIGGLDQIDRAVATIKKLRA